MHIRRIDYFILSLISLGFTLLFIFLDSYILFHIAFAITIYSSMRVFFLKANPTFIGLFSFMVLVMASLLVTSLKIFMYMTRQIDGLHYIFNSFDYLSHKYYFDVKSVYCYIMAIFSVSMIELMLKREKKIISLATPFIISAIMLISTKYAFDENIAITNYTIQSNKIDTNGNLKIVQISDTHNTIFKNNDLVEKIKLINPDLILMTGDIAEDVLPFTGTQLLLDGIKDIAPIYYTTGNHEYAADDFFEINKKIQSYGVHYLDNKYELAKINNQTLVIAGVNDQLSRYVVKPHKNIPDALTEMMAKYNIANSDNLKILLAHRPEMHDIYTKQDYDIVFTGHAHGGQVRIPFIIDGLVAPGQGFLPKYTSGVHNLHNNADTKMVISRGLSVNSLPRIFNPPEIVVVNVVGTK